MLDEHGFGDHGTRAAGTGESGDSRQQMQKKDGQIAHAIILSKIAKSKKCSRLLQFATHSSSTDSVMVQSFLLVRRFFDVRDFFDMALPFDTACGMHTRPLRWTRRVGRLRMTRRRNRCQAMPVR